MSNDKNTPDTTPEDTSVDQCLPATALENINGELTSKVCIGGESRNITLDTLIELIKDATGEEEDPCSSTICEDLKEVEQAPEFLGTDRVLVVTENGCLSKPVSDLCRIIAEK